MIQLRHIGLLLFLSVLLYSCDKKELQIPPSDSNYFIKACDLSFLPQIQFYPLNFLNREGKAEDIIQTLKTHGVNTIRLRLWYYPEDGHSGFEEVQKFSKTLQAAGMKTWIALHYSDIWADPGSQNKPNDWSTLQFEQLKDSVFAYTAKVCMEMKPDIIQIGNEINAGLLWPEGRFDKPDQMRALLSEGIRAVKEKSPKTKIVIHYAGHENAAAFFTSLSILDYDIAAISYYPIWHGKDLQQLNISLQQLHLKSSKKVLIAETDYPFTLEWNDWTNNIVGLEDQLIEGYSATAEGQKAFLQEIHNIMSAIEGGIGYCWWGAEWVAFKGPQSTDGSSWENQALWDFELKALPAIEVFETEVTF